MGQAKQRKAEIEQLKAKQTEVTFLAIRHTVDSTDPEFVFGTVNLGKPKNDKNALLAHICLNDWLHTPPAGAIAEYLLQTKTYDMMSKFGLSNQAYIINFHERDVEFTAMNKGKATHSCRDIVVDTLDNVREYAQELAKALKAKSDYSVQTD